MSGFTLSAVRHWIIVTAICRILYKTGNVQTLIVRMQNKTPFILILWNTTNSPETKQQIFYFISSLINKMNMRINGLFTVTQLVCLLQDFADPVVLQVKGAKGNSVLQKCCSHTFVMSCNIHLGQRTGRSNLPPDHYRSSAIIREFLQVPWLQVTAEDRGENPRQTKLTRRLLCCLISRPRNYT